MKKRGKKVLSVVLALCMISALLPTYAFASVQPIITVEKVSTELVTGKTIDVNVSIAENPGITSGSVELSFDKNSLKLIGISN